MLFIFLAGAKASMATPDCAFVTQECQLTCVVIFMARESLPGQRADDFILSETFWDGCTDPFSE